MMYLSQDTSLNFKRKSCGSNESSVESIISIVSNIFQRAPSEACLRARLGSIVLN